MKAHIEKNIFDQKYFDYLQNYFSNHDILNQNEYQQYGTKRIDSYNDPILKEAHKKLLNKAREIFKSENIMPSYAIFAEYSGNEAYLDKHHDIGPCTYTIDLCLYQKTSWPFYVENEKYEWEENEALFFYPNDQLHWREEFPEKETNKVGLIFFSYVEPDHVWLKLTEQQRKSVRDAYNRGKIL